MITRLSGWTRTLHPDGVTLHPPEGITYGNIRIRLDQRPLRSVSQLVDEIIATQSPAYRDPRKLPIEELITLEGEYAAMGGVLFTKDERGKEWAFIRNVGVVFGDDSMTTVTSIMQQEQNFPVVTDLVRRLTRYAAVGAGRVRRRRFRYDPPAGWQGFAWRLHTEWIPPDFPNDWAVIGVHPAKPQTEPPAVTNVDHALFEDLDAVFQIEVPPKQALITVPSGLSGRVVTVTGHYPGEPRIIRDVVVLEEKEFRYEVTLAAREQSYQRHQPTFEALCNTVKPIAALPGPPKRDMGNLIQWIVD